MNNIYNLGRGKNRYNEAVRGGGETREKAHKQEIYKAVRQAVKP